MLLEHERREEAYALVGHSHGGSVIYSALIVSIDKRRELKHLRCWCTIGTPFLVCAPRKLLFARLDLASLCIYVFAIASFVIPFGLLLVIIGFTDGSRAACAPNEDKGTREPDIFYSLCRAVLGQNQRGRVRETSCMPRSSASKKAWRLANAIVPTWRDGGPSGQSIKVASKLRGCRETERAIMRQGHGTRLRPSRFCQGVVHLSQGDAADAANGFPAESPISCFLRA